MNRATRQLVLTEAGQCLYADALRIVRLVDEAKQGAAAYQQHVRGVIRAPIYGRQVGSSVIIPALPQFLDKHPEVIVDLLAHRRACRHRSREGDVVNDGPDGRTRAWSPGPWVRLGRSCAVARTTSLVRQTFGAGGLGRARITWCLSARDYSNEWTFKLGGETFMIPVSGN